MYRTKQGSGSIGIWPTRTMKVSVASNYSMEDSQRYLDILDNYLKPSIDIFRKDMRIIFQQDNAPCHTAKICKQWFEENNIKIMSWPANSPDLNCIETLLSWFDHNLGKIKDLDQLKEEITKLLNNVPKDVTQKLVNSMPKRINECLNAKGLSTKY